MNDNDRPDTSDIAASVMRPALTRAAEERGDFAEADRLKLEQLRAYQDRAPTLSPEEREAAITKLREDSDAAAARGDFGLAARLKAEWLRNIEL